MDILLQDLRYAARKLFHTPGFTFIVVATLALAIGATTAVFSIVNGVLLKPLPLRAPNEIVAIGSVTSDPAQVGMMSAPDLIDYEARSHDFVDIAGVNAGNANLTIAGASPVRLTTLAVGASFFDVLGVALERGRGFVSDDDKRGAEKVVVLSDKLWRAQFRADPKVLGQSISIDGSAYAIVGVAPRELVYPKASDVWIPLIYEDWMVDPTNRGSHWLGAVARLRQNVAPDVAARDVRSISEALAKQYPESNANFRATAIPLARVVVGNSRATLLTMLGAVGFVLLIACANVANLLLVRASNRESEMALRTALGAGRTRIVRQLITESMLLALGGALLGVAVAMWSVDLVAAVGPRGLPRLNDIAVDGRVLAFTLGLTILTGFLFGMVPALYSARPQLAQMLRDGARSASARRTSSRVRSTLVIAQVALAVVLLVGAGLLIRSYAKLLETDPGFRAQQVTTFNVTVPELKYPYDRDRNRLAEQMLGALRQLPGTEDAAVALSRPMQTLGMRTSFTIDGRPAAGPTARLLAAVRPVSSGYFSTLGIRLVRGRLFTRAEEGFGVPQVVVVSEEFVKKYFPNEEALGKHITLGISHDTAQTNTSVDSKGEIVGVVRDVKQNTLNEIPAPAVYLPHGTLPESDMAFVIRSNSGATTLAAGIRAQVSQIDRDMPIYGLETMGDAISDSVAQPRFYLSLLGGFAGLALLLAALGIYGVISYGISQRVRELGIRIALGATNERILTLVLGQGLALVAVGLIVGIVGALALTRLLASLLYGVQPTDLPTLLMVPVLLAITAILASVLPARRAARIDPVIAMRSE